MQSKNRIKYGQKGNFHIRTRNTIRDSILLEFPKQKVCFVRLKCPEKKNHQTAREKLPDDLILYNSILIYKCLFACLSFCSFSLSPWRA